jgi:hypothetical protein
MTQETNGLDPVYESDRNGGGTAPETDEESSNIVGRPAGAEDHSVGFHESTETAELERESFNSEEALKEGGSFDGLGIPAAES